MNFILELCDLNTLTHGFILTHRHIESIVLMILLKKTMFSMC